MTIAELFITLGVKGSDKANRELKTTKTGLNDIKSSSLAAKAAILGVIYGIERLSMGVAREGAGLTEFAEATGLSIEQLQKWQYATRQFGVDAGEVEQSVRGIQNAMTDMLLGKGAPAGIEIIGQRVGLDQSKVRDTFYVLEKLQEFAKSNDEVDVNKRLLANFGISDKMFQALRRARSDVKNIKADMFKGGEARQLERVNAAWENLGRSIKLTLGHVVASKGIFAIGALGNSFKVLKEFGGWLTDVTKKYEVLGIAAAAVAVSIGLAFAPLTTIATGLILLLDQIQKYREGKDSIFADKDHIEKRKGVANFMKDPKKAGGMFDAMQKAVTPSTPGVIPNRAGETKIENNIQINTNSDDPREHARVVADELYSSFAQNPAMAIGN